MPTFPVRRAENTPCVPLAEEDLEEIHIPSYFQVTSLSISFLTIIPDIINYFKKVVLISNISVEIVIHPELTTSI